MSEGILHDPHHCPPSFPDDDIDRYYRGTDGSGEKEYCSQYSETKRWSVIIHCPDADRRQKRFSYGSLLIRVDIFVVKSPPTAGDALRDPGNLIGGTTADQRLESLNP
jgi:hypothetical protein